MATINASDILDQQPLPIDARDICTKVTLVVAGRPSGREPDLASQSLRNGVGSSTEAEYVTHYPRPIVYQYESDQHATYGAHKVLQLPADANPFLPPTSEEIDDPTDFVDSTNALLVRDGNPETAFLLHGAGTNSAWVRYRHRSSGFGSHRRIVGWRLMYWMDITTNSVPPVNISCRKESAGIGFDEGWRQAQWYIPATHDGEAVVTNDVWATIHDDARQQESEESFSDTLSWGVAGGPTWSLSTGLVHFYPLVLDEDYLESIAKAHIKIPASTPQRITVRGVVPVEATHEVGGNELTVARQTYEGGVTIIDFEQAGSPIGVPAEAFEAERVRLIREQTARASSLYPVTMGER